MGAKGTVRRIGVAAISALAIGVVAQTASAHKVTYGSSLQLKLTAIDDTTTQYSGKVSSTKGACESGRPVTVTANGAVIATATSIVGGTWSATGPTQAKNTTVVATIPRKLLKRNKKHRHKCAPTSANRKAH